VMSSETGPLLIVELLHGGKVAIPGLEYDLLQSIFKAHEESMEHTEQEETITSPAVGLNFPIKLFGDNAEKMGMLLQHNPDDSDAPAMPQEMLDKISSMIKSLGLSESSTIPVPEEGCNCNFCQISRAIHDVINPKTQTQEAAEEAVPETELQFRDWDITAKGDELYDVTNRLDKSENYQVYLGKPIGCTCGSASCEHIRAVLRS
jgi:hypothetical protein